MCTIYNHAPFLLPENLWEKHFHIYFRLSQGVTIRRDYEVLWRVASRKFKSRGRPQTMFTPLRQLDSIWEYIVVGSIIRRSSENGVPQVHYTGTCNNRRKMYQGDLHKSCLFSDVIETTVNCGENCGCCNIWCDLLRVTSSWLYRRANDLFQTDTEDSDTATQIQIQIQIRIQKEPLKSAFAFQLKTETTKNRNNKSRKGNQRRMNVIS